MKLNPMGTLLEDLLADSLDDDLVECLKNRPIEIPSGGEVFLLIAIQALRHLNAVEAAVTRMDEEGVATYVRGLD